MNFTGDYRNIKVYGNQGVDTSNPKILKDEDRDRELDQILLKKLKQSEK